MKNFLTRLLGKEKKKKRLSPQEYEWRVFRKQAREQFLKLKEKGLSIRVMSL